MVTVPFQPKQKCSQYYGTYLERGVDVGRVSNLSNILPSSYTSNLLNFYGQFWLNIYTRRDSSVPVGSRGRTRAKVTLGGRWWWTWRCARVPPLHASSKWAWSVWGPRGVKNPYFLASTPTWVITWDGFYNTWSEFKNENLFLGQGLRSSYLKQNNKPKVCHTINSSRIN